MAALVGCTGLGAPSSPVSSPTPAPSVVLSGTPAALTRPTPPETAGRCATGRLTVGDIPLIDAAWQAGLAAADERARAWRSDARLVAVRVACEPLEPTFRWQGTFYSDAAQSFFQSDSGQTEPAEVDPASVVTLPRDRISFLELHRVLARSGYADDTFLSATGGITVRFNAPTDPFGPPGTPADVVYHVAADVGDRIDDLFVSTVDWRVRTYQR